MKLEHAIQLLQKDIDDPGSVAIEDVNKAELLGIEALKAITAFREDFNITHFIFLPGETES